MLLISPGEKYRTHQDEVNPGAHRTRIITNPEILFPKLKCRANLRASPLTNARGIPAVGRDPSLRAGPLGIRASLSSSFGRGSMPAQPSTASSGNTPAHFTWARPFRGKAVERSHDQARRPAGSGLLGATDKCATEHLGGALLVNIRKKRGHAPLLSKRSMSPNPVRLRRRVRRADRREKSPQRTRMIPEAELNHDAGRRPGRRGRPGAPDRSPRQD